MTSVQPISLNSLKTDLGDAMPTAQQGPDPTFFTVLLLTDSAHFEQARQFIREGDRSLAMEFQSEEGEKQFFTVNDVEHRVGYYPDPMDRDQLKWFVESNVFWKLSGAPYPEHGAVIAIKRARGSHALSDLLALTEVVHAITQKVQTRAVVWFPYAAVKIEEFDYYYDYLYKTGSLPIFVWIKFFWGTDGKDIVVMSAGLTELGLPEIELVTLPENIVTDTNLAKNAVEWMLSKGAVFPDGWIYPFDLGGVQGSVRVSYRPSRRDDGSTAHFLEITRLAGGRPLPGVH